MQKLSALLAAAALTAVTLTVLPPDTADAGAPAPKSPLDFTVKDIDGKNVNLSRYKGKVVLIVNTASQCGYTPQYASLESLYQKYQAKGLRILAFPANDFGAQEPGKDEEIKAFCSSKYRTTFDLFSKVAAKGSGQAPLYKFLTGTDTNPKFAGDIKWNFTKFLVNKKGQVIARFEPGTDPLTPEVIEKVEAALK
jgi:glutathione peroxidase